MFSILMFGCRQDADQSSAIIDIEKPSVYTVLVKEERFTSFVSMIEKANLEKWMNDESGITIFVPTNEAIQPLLQNKEIMNQIISEPQYIENLVRAHTIPKKLSFEKLQKSKSVFNANEQEIAIISGETKVMLNGKIELINAPIEAENGIIYPISGVLME